MEDKAPVTVDDLTMHLDSFMAGLDAKFTPLARIGKFFWGILASMVLLSFYAGAKATEMVSRVAQLEAKAAKTEELSLNVAGLTKAVEALSKNMDRILDKR